MANNTTRNGKHGTVVIHVDLDKKCMRCGKEGATQNGLCMKCIADGIKRGDYDHIIHGFAPKVRKGRTKE
jgi:hypothetical protein